MVELEIEHGVAWVRLNHPPLNILTTELRRQLLTQISRIENDSAVRLAIFQGAGEKAFSVGSDLKEFPNDEVGGREKIQFEQFVLDQIERLRVITLSGLRGHVLGGGAELMLATDLRIAADDAMFGFPEIKVGGFPAAGGVWRLTRDIGPVRARELLLFGKTISAPQAHALNLINECVPKERLEPRLKEIADELLALPQSGLLAIKRAVALTADGSTEGFSGAAQVTNEYGRLFRGADISEGIRAFLEKRTPHYNQIPKKE
ncbi:MAG: enoyl-CoA hydratase/isomerase family protein, partial [Edaphobacter sp.]